jgi:hypothetical protein
LKAEFACSQATKEIRRFCRERAGGGAVYGVVHLFTGSKVMADVVNLTPKTQLSQVLAVTLPPPRFDNPLYLLIAPLCPTMQRRLQSRCLEQFFCRTVVTRAREIRK